MLSDRQRALDPSLAGSVTHNPVAATGTLSARNPDLATFNSRLAAGRRLVASREAEALSEAPARQAASPPEGPSVVPAILRPRKQGTIHLQGNETSTEVAGAVQDAWDGWLL
jgi:hypothetical protein